MAIAKTFWLRLRETVISLWIAFAEVLIAFVEDFVEEVIFRVGLACRILAGRVPLKAERRWWNRSLETPVLVDVVDFSDERLLFSVLIWPALESGPRGFDSDRAHRERVEEVLAVIAKGPRSRCGPPGGTRTGASSGTPGAGRGWPRTASPTTARGSSSTPGTVAREHHQP